MSNDAKQDQGLSRIVEQLCAMESVACEEQADGRLVLRASCYGATAEATIATDAVDYRRQKDQYGHLYGLLTDLGIREGDTFVAPPPPRRAMTPHMQAAREKQKREFDAWQDVWQGLRRAEKALDVAYEIVQMRDYY